MKVKLSAKQGRISVSLRLSVHFLNCAPWDLNDPWCIIKTFQKQSIPWSNNLGQKWGETWIDVSSQQNFSEHMSFQKGVDYSTYLTEKASLFAYVSLKVVGHSLWNVSIHTLTKIGTSQWFQIMSYMRLWLNYAGKITKKTHWPQISRPTPRGRVAETWRGRKGM